MFRVIFINIIFFFIVLTSVHGAVIIKVRAINPLDTEVIAPIKYPLPKAMQPGDIIEKRMIFNGQRIMPSENSEDGQEVVEGSEPVLKSDFNINYDEEKGYYFVDEEVSLGPKQIVTLEIVVNDVWQITDNKIESLWKEAEMVKNSEDGTVGEDDLSNELKQEIFQSLEEVVSRQTENEILKVGADKHIQAYEKNIEVLQQVEEDIFMLKNLLEE